VILELNPVSGATVRQFPLPAGFVNGLEGLAFDGRSLFYISHTEGGRLYELDPDTGAVRDVDAVTFGNFDSLAALNGKTYVGDYNLSTIYEFDPVAFTDVALGRRITAIAVQQ
jgi:outer membrane protein assembly factor BamB